MAERELPPIRVRILADDSQFTSTIQSLSKTSDKVFDKVATSIRKVTSATSDLNSALGMFASAASTANGAYLGLSNASNSATVALRTNSQVFKDIGAALGTLPAKVNDLSSAYLGLASTSAA